MNAAEYAKYEATVAAALEDLTHVSSGACPGCDECGLSGKPPAPICSRLPCDCCGDAKPGNRYVAHGRDTNNEIVHLDVCSDCRHYIEKGTGFPTD